MPFDGSGNYTRFYGATGWTDDKNAAIKILSSRHDTHDQDLATAFNNCLTRDGQGKPSAALSWAQALTLAPLSGTALTLTPTGGVALTATGTGSFSGALTAASFVPTSTAVNGLGLSAANTPALYSNSTLRWSVNSTGNHVFAAQSSGVAATINSVAAGTALRLTDGVVTASFDFGGQFQFGSFSNHPVFIYSNNSTRISIAAAGNVTINAPSSGVALAVTGVAGGTSQSWTDGTRAAAIAHSVSLVQIGTTTADSFGIFVNSSNRATFNTGLQLGSPTGGDKGAGTLNTAGAIYQNGLQLIDSGSFSSTMAGGTTAPSVTVQWYRIGNVVHIAIPAISATSNGTTFTMGSLPAGLRLSTGNTTTAMPFALDNSARAFTAAVMIDTTGFMTFLKNGDSNAWTAAGQKGFDLPIQFSYLLS